MPKPTPATHVILSNRDRVVGSANSEAEAESHLASLPGQAGRIVDLTTADVATLARIAFNDCPDLARRGSGFLGAGTHPAQPYLETMLGMRGVDRTNASGMTFGHDRVVDIVNSFVGNASTWRGDTARAVKAALRGWQR